MFSRIWIVLLIMVLLSSCTTPKSASINTNTECSYDRARLMAMDEQHFDQDLANGGGGWRAIASIHGCESTAADLIRDYRKTHDSRSSILYWHEGQLRAVAGDYAHAIALMERTRRPISMDGWNDYVEATIAFLRRDRAALADARAKLAKLQWKSGSGYPPVKNGFVELTMTDGQTVKMRWPPNLDVVDGLIRCFGRSYRIAYHDCRAPSHQRYKLFKERSSYN